MTSGSRYAVSYLSIMDHETSDTLLFFVNGRKVIEESPDPGINLLAYLRNELRQTGSKLACGEGGCGACTVMVSKWNEQTKSARHYAINACITPIASVHQCAITTVEGIGSTTTRLHQVQERLANFHGSQCGFCTPGIVMSMYTLLRNKKLPSSRDIETWLRGNLCRCTGYRPIISAFQTFTCAAGDQCCRNQLARDGDSGVGGTWKPYDPSQEPIFPPELIKISAKQSKSLKFVGKSLTWHQPSNMQEMLSLWFRYPNATIVAGYIGLAFEHSALERSNAHLISVSKIQQMTEMSVDDKCVTIGAACGLTSVKEYLENVCSEKSPAETQILHSILDILCLVGSIQIRNVATFGGNIIKANSTSDLSPLLVACKAKLTFLTSTSKTLTITMDAKYLSECSSLPHGILVSIKIPLLTESDVSYAFKQTRRIGNDAAIVNGAVVVSFGKNTNIIESLSMAYGGMDEKIRIPFQTMSKASGRSWDAHLLEDVCYWLSEELKLPQDVLGGMVRYKRTLAVCFFFKFYHLVLAKLVEREVVEETKVELDRGVNNPSSAEDEPFSSIQTWHQVPDKQPIEDTIGRPIQHLAGFKHVCGEAEFLDDIPLYKDELHMAPVLSNHAHARIVSIDTSDALSCPGVVDYVDVRDVIGENLIFQDEDVFADGKVTCVGHVIGAILADTTEHALNAAPLVKIEYEDLSPKIIAIEDAIQCNSYYDTMTLVKGDAVEAFKRVDHVLEAEIRIGGQEHFYMEPQSCIAVPRNKEGEMEIFSSTQFPDFVQSTAATCLGLPRNKVTVRTKRLGGGFGGKGLNSCKITNPTVIAAKKTGRPIRCVFTRVDDMQITGGRHPFLAKYKVGFNNDGRITTLKLALYSNAGHKSVLSVGVMEKAIWQSDNCYNVLDADITGYVCRTNLPSNTAFRAFGAPQATLIAEDWITRVAEVLKTEPEKVREINMYKNGDKFVFGAPVKDLNIRRCWEECLKKSQFVERRRLVNEFNVSNRWKKRGISCVPAKYSVASGFAAFNQSSALVLVYADGNVLLFHGGVEMGQGLHTKMVQVASRCLGISTELIHISEMSTTAVPNAPPTSASINSDVNGMAIKNACEEIMKRLAPLKESNQNMPWKEIVARAYQERISLSATGFYKIPGINHTWNAKTGDFTGTWASYQVSGTAVSEVEIDVLTGHHAVLRTDIVMDVGNSLNPAIDIGQIEGAFIQGYGLFTLEEIIHSPSGELQTMGFRDYKIPSIVDTPRTFNVHLLEDSPNDKAIFSSKAVGEPPLVLATSVFFALKDAIKFARAEVGLTGSFTLDSPATAERIRLGCQDKFTDMAKV